eukprot:11592841-Ditylum_brightwellii.AAC.1
MGYMTIQKVLDDADVNYNRHTIIQSFNLKKKLEALKLTDGEATLMSLAIENMCLSIRVKLIKKALAFYSRKLSDKYYIYQGTAKGKNLTDENIALAMGSYESAFLADLVVSYVFETTGK